MIDKNNMSKRSLRVYKIGFLEISRPKIIKNRGLMLAKSGTL